MENSIWRISEKELLEKLKEVYFEQKNSKDKKIVAFIIEILFSLVIVYFFFSELHHMMGLVFGIIGIFGIIIFYVKIIMVEKREKQYMKNLDTLMERMGNFKEYKAGKTRFNLKKDLSNAEVTKTEKDVEKQMEKLLKVAEFTKAMALSPINFNYFSHEFVTHFGALRIALIKLKSFDDSNKL